jgi:hypothetical protein
MIVGTISDEIVRPVATGQQHANLAFHLAKDGLRLVFQRGGVAGRRRRCRSSYGMGKAFEHVGLRRFVVRVIETSSDTGDSIVRMLDFDPMLADNQR